MISSKKDYMEKFASEVNESLKNSRKWKRHYVTDLKISDSAKMVIADMDAFHNHSFAVEVYLRNKDNLDKTALLYRGNKITYGDMFDKVYAYAKSLKTMGYGAGSEVPVCATNIPEFVYLFLATNLIGAKLNSIGEWFDKDYTKFILEHSKSNTIFISDDVYDALKDKLNDINFNNLVIVPLSNSLPSFRGENGCFVFS